MSLINQVHLYSIDTSSLYTKEENYWHQRLLRLYSLKNKKKITPWKIKSINRLIKKNKKELIKILEKNNENKIVRELNPQALTDKSVISIFDSSLTRALELKHNELTEQLFILNVFFFQVFEDVVKRGFYYKGEKYIFLTASAGQIRQKKCQFIKESCLKEIEGRITCGLNIETINEKGGCNPNKYLAYFSLSNSATDVWEGFDIDKAIVVEDFESNVLGTVDFIDDKTYEIERRDMEVPIPHTDGCGIMLDSGTRMARLPWIKGLMVEYHFDHWLEEKAKPCNYIVTDIYGKKYNVIEEGIRYIFTKSQFKMWKYYDSWEDYKTRFKANNCQACYCNLEESYIPNAKLNYQFIQSLTDMSEKEIDKLIKPTVEDIEKIGNDYQTTLRLLGVNDYNPNPSYIQQALKIYPELMRDQYNREILKDVKKSLIRQAKSGRVRVNGGYRFVSPDLYAFCEHLFLGVESPKGLLGGGEVYCKGYKNGAELACLRSPHLYREWPIRNNVRNEEIDKWFGSTQCVYTSTQDLISKTLQFDCDGDKLLVIKDNNLTQVAKRNMQGIVPLYYEMKKAEPVQLSKETVFEGIITAYSTGNIGPYSNNISKTWNGDKVGEQEFNVIRWLCMENNFCIDTAKTLYMPARPPKVDEIIKSYTRGKVPNFFIHAKDKTIEQVETPTNSTMNQIASKIPEPKISYCNTIGKFDYKKLMGGKGVEEAQKEHIVGVYDYWSKRRNSLFSHEPEGRRNEDEMFVYQEIRRRIIEDTSATAERIVDALVEYLYTERNTSKKQMLWACFGDVIVENLNKNLANAKPICPVCGKRFSPRDNANTTYCSKNCYQVSNVEKQRIRDSR